MRNYLLLTPGPLSTSETVKEAMLQDWCTWDKDYNEGIVTVIRKELLEVAGLDEKEYTTVLLQGSGTYGVEATLGAVVKPTDRLLIIANGAYGKRMAAIADYYKLDYVMVALKETELITPAIVEEALKNHPGISHLSLVHSETTTGLLNPIEEIAEVLRGRGITWIVDAMTRTARAVRRTRRMRSCKPAGAASTSSSARALTARSAQQTACCSPAAACPSRCCTTPVPAEKLKMPPPCSHPPSRIWSA